MKSHTSKASRKSFDVTKMSGPEIAAEMSRQMTEFKSARKHSDPAVTRQEGASSEAHSKRSGDHHFLRASLAAGAGSALSALAGAGSGSFAARLVCAKAAKDSKNSGAAARAYRMRIDARRYHAPVPD